MSESPIPIDQVSLEDVDLTPRFVDRNPRFADHGAYLEAMHESTHRNLAVIHLCLAKGETEYATDLMRVLRAHIEALWDQHKEAVQR